MNNYLKYSSMAIQMGVIIGVFTFIGYKLDRRYKLKQPYCTIVFSLLGVGIALYTAMRDFIKPNKTP
jgi:F0F1-type ATP synthase assembly protein I